MSYVLLKNGLSESHTCTETRSRCHDDMAIMLTMISYHCYSRRSAPKSTLGTQTQLVEPGVLFILSLVECSSEPREKLQRMELLWSTRKLA